MTRIKWIYVLRVCNFLSANHRILDEICLWFLFPSDNTLNDLESKYAFTVKVRGKLVSICLRRQVPLH